MTVEIGTFNPAVRCPVHDVAMQLKTSVYGKFYGCPNYPTCRETHGAHPNGEPKGIPGDKETRQWRIMAHSVFDELWNKADQQIPEYQQPTDESAIATIRRTARVRAYAWLREQMSMTKEDCHIGRFTIEQCKHVIEIARTGSALHIRVWWKQQHPRNNRPGRHKKETA